MRARLFTVLVTVLVTVVSPLFAQTNSATLSGLVTDPTGAVIAGANVTLTNLDTSVEQQMSTNSAGQYFFTSVPPGNYKLSVKMQGFKEAVRRPLVLHVQDALGLNIKLELGSASETVEVSAETTPVNVLDATVSTVVERQTVANMPLNGRSFQNLITLAPGVATVVPSANSGGGQFVVNGQRSDTNYFTVDGVSANVAPANTGGMGSSGAGGLPATSATGGYNNLVSVDALQEFRIETSSFAPEFGRTPGGQIALQTRGGTNRFHGDAFDYLRNTVLDANDWFLNAKGKPRGVVQQNDFGGVIGGPIVRDKLFFFASYEGLRLNAPTPSQKLVPTADARAIATGAKSNGVTGYMAQFANAYPLPDPGPAANAQCISVATCYATYTASFPSRSVLNSTSARVDYNLNKRMTLFGRYSHAPSSLTSNTSTDSNPLTQNTDTYTAGWTWTFSNSTTNDLRYNFTHTTLVLGQNPILFKGSLSTIYPSGFAQIPSGYGLGASDSSMAIQIRSSASDGLLISPFQANSGNDGQNIADVFTWIKGAHALKFGFDWRELNPAFDQANFNENNTFGPTTTALPGFPSTANVCPASVLPASTAAGPVTSKTIPGFLCGQATTSNLQHNFVQHFNIKQYSIYAQDTWRATQRMTLTYGLRWEIDPALSWTSHNPGFSVPASSFTLSDLSHIGLNPLGTPPYPTSWGELAPRVGIAYQMSTSANWGSVVRVGYGVFYDPGVQVATLLGNPFNARFNNVGSGASIPIVQYPISTANAFFVTPPAPRLTLPVSQGGTDDLIDPHFKLPYVHQLNLTIEQSLGAKQTLSAGYVGALGRHLVGAKIFGATQGNVNTFAQINPSTGAATADALNIFGNYANSDYESLQTKFQRQFSKGLGAVASYTWGHAIDDVSSSGLGIIVLPTAAQVATGHPLQLARGSSDFDVRHLFSMSLVYESPNAGNRVTRAVLGHWTLAPIYHYQTATPIDLTTGTTGALGGTGYAERPNLIAGVPLYVSGSTCAAQYQALGTGITSCPGGRALNLAPVTIAQAAAAGCITTGLTAGGTFSGTANARGAFCTPAPVSGQAISGNFGRNVIRGFPLQEFDFSVHRDFPMYESVRLRFEADLFNVFNHPSFGGYGSVLNAAAFGVTNAMANSALGANNSQGQGVNPIFQTGGPRNFQFALKLFF